MKLHHVGKVVRNLDKARKTYKNLFGLEALGAPVVDPLQKVEVQFLSSGQESGPVIELISPVSQDSPVSKFLEDAGGLHHLCFEVEDVSKAIEILREKGALVLGKPLPGKGHDDRLTAWIYTSDKELIELVETDRS